MESKKCVSLLSDWPGIKMAIGILFLAIGFIAAFSGCSDSDSTATTNPVVASVITADEDGTVAIASVTNGDLDVENATVSVNGVNLAYGLPLQFSTQEGIDVNIILPVYYAELNQFTSGDVVNFSARTANGALIYDRSMVTIPGKPTLIQPVASQNIPSDENVSVQWNAATDAEGYVAGYVETDAFDEASTDDDDAGVYAEYVEASQTEMSVPSLYTIVGDAIFSVDAVSGDTIIFTSEENPTESFFIAGTSDWVEAKITADTGNQFSATENQVTENRGSQGLTIVKEYTKKIEGYKFKLRECDPNQIQNPGTVSLGFKLRRFKASIAFVTLYDMNGKEYASWQKKRIFKTSDKKYYPSFSVSPGTTVVFGSHDASYRGGTYSY